METIHRELDGAPLPDIKVCSHIAGWWPVPVSVYKVSEQYKQCANCSGYLCADCEDDAVICTSGPHSICAECKETARRRTITKGWGGCPSDPLRKIGEYLCAPCCDKQDMAKAIFAQNCAGVEILLRFHPDMWLDELTEPMGVALEKAMEAL
jgi:hypothetical protein